jgi:hypothetical protein
MSLDATNPLYDAKIPLWVQMRDFYTGEERVKSKGVQYLPPTKGMQLDGMGTTARGGKKLGQEVYEAYLSRAVFPDYVKEAVEAYVGLLHQKDATIELPAVMEDMRDRATLHGESLLMLLRRINEEQLVTGRVGLLLDLPLSPDPANPLPYIALYAAEAVRNWDDGQIGEGLAKLNLVVLDESGLMRAVDFKWETVSKYRVLMLDAPMVEGDTSSELVAIYQYGVFKNTGTGAPVFVKADMRPPMIRGNTLDEIPFVFVNSKDITPSPDEPPLMGLARLCKAIYQGEADFRQNLFMQGQDTLVIVGDRKKRAEELEDDAPLRTGAGSVIELETGGSAEYIGVNSQGLSEQRQTLDSDRARAESRSGQLISARANGVESGEALKTRVAAQTATLNQIAKTGAAALESLLKIAAKWIGANPDEVKVTPNLEFADYDMTGDNLVKLMTARTMGAPISKRSIHDLMADQGLTKLDYETEVDTIAEEDAESPPRQGTMTGGNPDDPNDPANTENSEGEA